MSVVRSEEREMSRYAVEDLMRFNIVLERRYGSEPLAKLITAG